ncbi:MAG: 50S ribosomal protein L32 [Actinobacteria bacterium]|nr:50S ribosomal protein L32 [Actinomycetota bacterium]
MPVPKRKLSRARTRWRRSMWRTTAANTVLCEQCRQPRLQHIACPTCGTYRDRNAVEV